MDHALSARGLRRRVAVTIPYFAPAAAALAHTDLVLTAPARLARRMAERHALALVPPPLPLPDITFHACWHERAHADPAHAWLRALLARVCAAL